MWEDRYSQENGYLFGTAPAGFLTENQWVVGECETALCVADGEGRNAVHLARNGLRVTAFDGSPTAVARANDLAAQHGVALDARVSDWAAFDWRGQYDLVVGIFIQFANPEFRAQQFADMQAAIRSGGRIALHGYRPEQVALGTGGPPDAANMYTETLLRDAFAGWQIERLASYERDVQEGRGHSGKSALIDLVATKPGAR
ncbi:SAM-dependent methyltransferase [Octadecabacter sp. R77987]|uniref:SAM-dependent methyltransferase n=1 Tax=Octadecabacter sp. R77987 TaxID=3093874 RepID=UPI00366C6562